MLKASYNELFNVTKIDFAIGDFHGKEENSPQMESFSLPCRFPSLNGVCSLVSFSGFIEHQWCHCELLQFLHASYVICCDVRSLCCLLEAISTLASKRYMNFNNAITGYALLIVREHKLVAIMLCTPKFNAVLEHKLVYHALHAKIYCAQCG